MSRLSWLGVFLAASAAMADAAPIFTDTFTNGSTVGGASVPGGTPTASFTSYDIASTKNASGSTISGGVLSIGMPATTSGFYEAQAVFSTTPVALAAVNDSLTLRYVFTDSANVLTGTGLTSSSALWTGLYNSASSIPLTTLANTGLTTTQTTGSILTAGVAPWQGFVMRIAATGTNGAVGSSQLYTRPAQTTGTSSAVQELLGNNVGGGAYNGPTGSTFRTLSGSGSPTLTVGEQYTVDYTITLLGTGTLGITGNLFSGAGTGGPLLFTASGTATGANALTTSFDGLAIGYRYNGTSVASSLNVNSIEVTATIVPEPATVVLAGLGLAALLRASRRLRT
jgi:hypothetical protein